MKKLVLIFLLFIPKIVAAQSQNPTLAFSTDVTSSRPTGDGHNIANRNIGAHIFTWSVQQGVLTSCTLSFETSPNNTTWTQQTTGDCTSGGTSNYLIFVANYVRVRATTYVVQTAPAMVTVAYAGYIVAPNSIATITTSPLNNQNINGMLFAANYTGSDIGAKVNAVLASADYPIAGATVYIAPGSYTFSTTINMNKPVRIVCSGRDTTILTYSGTGNAIVNSVGTTYPYMNSGISGCTLNGNSNTNAWGIKHIDTIGALYEDLAISGFTGSSGGGIWFDNEVTFSERTTINKVTMSNNTNGWKFSVTGGVNSFMYWSVLSAHFQVEYGQIGINIVGTGSTNGVYLGKWYATNIGFNLTDVFGHMGAGAKFLKITQGAGFTQHSNISITGEQTSGTGGVIFDIDATSFVDGDGSVQAAPLGSTIAGGGILKIVPRICDTVGSIYCTQFVPETLTADKTITIPNDTGRLLLSTGTVAGSTIDNGTNSVFLRYAQSSTPKWAIGFGCSPAGDRGCIYSYTEGQNVFDALAGGDTTITSKSGNIALNPVSTGAVVIAANVKLNQGNVNDELAGGITILSGATTGVKTFASAFNSAPACVFSPIQDPVPTTLRFYITTTTTTATITASAAVTGNHSFYYHCIGNPN